jgi:5'-3' exoribonuclease 1
VRVELEVPPPPPTFGRRIALQTQENFYHLSDVSRRLNISPKVLSKITASVYAQHQNRKINIGLRIKFTRKGQQMLGYTQRIETPSSNGISRGYWMYSAKALDLVYQFMQRFPDLFQALEAEDAQEIEVFSPEMLFPNGNAAARMTEVEEWLKHLETNNLQRVPIGSKAMPKEAVKTVEEESNRYVANNNARKKKLITIESTTNLLATPLSDIPTTDEESAQTDISLGERVMNLRDNGPIPFGLKGTVTGIVSNLLEIVFDEEFLGGTNLGDRCSDLRGQQHIPPTTVLNLGRGPGPKRGGRNAGPQHNPWANKPEHRGQGQGQQAPASQQAQPPQHHQSQHPQSRPNRGGQGGDKPVAILQRGGGDRRDIRKSAGDKVMYRPKQQQPQGSSVLLARVRWHLLVL